jgi:GT2 family glycosyltransferase
MNELIYILVPTHNRKKITADFVRSLKRQTYQNFKLVLIDDGSSDGTADVVIKEMPSSIILKGDGNLWWAGALQLAINHLGNLEIANDSVILITNDDTIIQDDFLEIGLREIASERETIICASSKLDGKIVSSGVHFNWINFGFAGAENESQINCLPTRGILLRFSDILKIGGFRPKVLPHYLSDYEFTYRAHCKGYKLRCPPTFYLAPMLNETGIRSFAQNKGISYLKMLFSKRCVMNPIYLAFFILLASPMKYKLRNLYDLFLMTAKGIVKNLA